MEQLLWEHDRWLDQHCPEHPLGEVEMDYPLEYLVLRNSLDLE